MKKFCLLAIVSCFATLGFSQNAVTTQTYPGKPKANIVNKTNTTTGTATFSSANGQSSKTASTTTNTAVAPKSKYRVHSKATPKS